MVSFILISSFYLAAQNESLYVIEHKCPAASIINNFIIQGIVYDTLTNEELPYATVYVKGTKIAAMTNEKGIFSFDISSVIDTSKNISLIISYINYRTKEIDPISKLKLGGYISIAMIGKDNAIYCPGVDVKPKRKRKR